MAHDCGVAGEVLCRGEGQARCLPDRATLQVAVQSGGISPDEAFAAASRAATTVDGVLDRFAAALERRLTSGVMVSAKTRWQNGEAIPAGWQASRTTVVDVRDFSDLGKLIAQLTAAGASAVNGPSWQVDRDNPAYRDARRQAAVDARERAQTYAEALGLRLGALSWISEPGLRLPGPAGSGVTMPAGMRLASSQMSAPEPMDIGPDQMTIEATVEACFNLSPGPQ